MDSLEMLARTESRGKGIIFSLLEVESLSEGGAKGRMSTSLPFVSELI